MSRIDDELKLIYGRKEPSPDFTARVMQQIAARQTVAPPVSRKGLWQTLRELIEIPPGRPKFRLAAAGFAACLLVALFAAQYARREAPTAGGPEVAGQAGAPSGPTTTGGAAGSEKVIAGGYVRPTAIPARRVAVRKHAHNIARSNERVREEPVDEKTLAEGNAAKEKVMLALQIASSTLNEAQRIVQGDSRRGDR
ncbi:MAG TPA: hypothetical protein VNH22_13630 [Blastocatellia bacterium]|jgi:hypothetical protein|nr:hypothetical protein [Blastocatellia bacterium]